MGTLVETFEYETLWLHVQERELLSGCMSAEITSSELFLSITLDLEVSREASNANQQMKHVVDTASAEGTIVTSGLVWHFPLDLWLYLNAYSYK